MVYRRMQSAHYQCQQKPASALDHSHCANLLWYGYHDVCLEQAQGNSHSVICLCCRYLDIRYSFTCHSRAYHHEMVNSRYTYWTFSAMVVMQGYFFLTEMDGCTQRWTFLQMSICEIVFVTTTCGDLQSIYIKGNISILISINHLPLVLDNPDYPNGKTESRCGICTCLPN